MGGIQQWLSACGYLVNTLPDSPSERQVHDKPNMRQLHTIAVNAIEPQKTGNLQQCLNQGKLRVKATCHAGNWQQNVRSLLASLGYNDAHYPQFATRFFV